MTAQHAAERARVVVIEMPTDAAYVAIQRDLNEHVLGCPVCRSDQWGICPEADRMLDDLLAVLQAPRKDEPTWY